jgi:hypothetical protein
MVMFISLAGKQRRAYITGKGSGFSGTNPNKPKFFKFHIIRSAWTERIVSNLISDLQTNVMIRSSMSEYLHFWSVGIAQRYSAGLRAGWAGVWDPAGAGNFSFHRRVQTDTGAHPASNPMGIMGSFFGVKWQGHEGDHSPPSSSEGKNVWSYASTSPIRFLDVVLGQKVK